MYAKFCSQPSGKIGHVRERVGGGQCPILRLTNGGVIFGAGMVGRQEATTGLCWIGGPFIEQPGASLIPSRFDWRQFVGINRDLETGVVGGGQQIVIAFYERLC